MSNFSIVQLVVTFLGTLLGGGAIGAWIHNASTARSEKRRRHSSYVQEQLDRLYGPLYFLSGQNEELIKLNHKIMDAYSEHFVRTDWSQNPDTQASVKRESSETIDLANTYVNQIVENNEAIVTLLRDNYALVDVEDIELFQTFSIDALRVEKEVKAGVLKQIPIQINKMVGVVPYVRAEFLDRVKQQFVAKQDLLKKYH